MVETPCLTTEKLAARIPGPRSACQSMTRLQFSALRLSLCIYSEGPGKKNPTE